MSERKKIFLIDGSNHAFRVFHAMPRNMFASGFPTGALLGFANMLRRLEKEHAPDHIVVVFDDGPSFRVRMYPDYKGHRPEKPEELDRQWPFFKELVEAWGYPYITQKDLEADDIIGTLAHTFAGPDCEIVMVTGDKDFYQLVNEHCRVLDVMKNKWVSFEGVKERFGVGPEQVIDILGLAGDSSDNVPGVPGVGEKTAIKYVTKYGDFESVLENWEDIGGKRGAAVHEFADQARLSRELTTIKVDADIPLTLEDLSTDTRDVTKLRQLFIQWQFRTLMKELQNEATEAVSSIDRSHYATITTIEQLDAAIEDIQAARFDRRRLSLALQTTSPDPQKARLAGIALAWGPTRIAYVPVGRPGLDREAILERLAPVLADPRIPKTGHQLKLVRSALVAMGLQLHGRAGDTLLADYLLEPTRTNRSLRDLALRYLGHELLKEPEPVQQGLFDAPKLEEVAARFAERAHVAWLLDRELEQRMEKLGVLGVYRDIELPLVDVLSDIELTGIGVDLEGLKALSDEFGQRLEKTQARIFEVAGREFTINSPKQLQVILFDELGLEPIKKTKTGFSTDHATLEKLRDQHELPGLILDWRSLDKLKSTYVDALPLTVSSVDGRIHTSLTQAVAATGRLSSNDPNLQNIPVRSEDGRRIRECFVAPEGHVFLSCDYSQVELRLLAHFCGGGALAEAFAAGEDIHRKTASQIFEIPLDEVSAERRSAAKAINFGIIYGMSAFRLANDLNISKTEAQAYMDKYFAQYPEVKGFVEGAVERAKESGNATTLYGRKRLIAELASRNSMNRWAAERIAVNTPIQGSAADLIKLAMLAVVRRIKADAPDARLILQVHDELLFEVPEDRAQAIGAVVKEEMEGVAPLTAPLKVDVGWARTWAQAH